MSTTARQFIAVASSQLELQSSSGYRFRGTRGYRGLAVLIRTMCPGHLDVHFSHQQSMDETCRTGESEERADDDRYQHATNYVAAAFRVLDLAFGRARGAASAAAPPSPCTPSAASHAARFCAARAVLACSEPSDA